MKQITAMFKALSDETRLRLFFLLNREKRGVAVCELVDAVRKNQYNVSKHLHILEAAGLIRANKSGRWVLYSPEKNLPKGINTLILSLDSEKTRMDLKRLKNRLKRRKQGKIILCSPAREFNAKQEVKK